MLPQKPMSEMTDQEILEAIREIRARRVAAKVRSTGKKRRSPEAKARDDEAISRLIDAALADEPPPAD